MDESLPIRDPGSFRDPAGHVYRRNGRIFRTINARAVGAYRFVKESGVLRDFAERGLLIGSDEVEAGLLDPGNSLSAELVVEHPRIPFVSYPYEWPFPALKAAALHHLDLHIELLARDATLSDATAYNIQFIGPRPVFIDLLSLRPYREGEFWAGYRQFCEQFLNPLLLRSLLGIAHNAWYRGSPEGLPSAELARMLPLGKRLSPRVLTHVVLHGRLQASSGSRKPEDTRKLANKKLSRRAFLGILHQLRSWIAGLRPADRQKTSWADYTKTHSYSPEEYQAKQAQVAEFTAASKPGILWDLGCNTGEYSQVALESGADSVIGFDFDQGALDAAFARARDEKLNFLPLFLDATNPSPDQGWRQGERAGLDGRRNADAILALAFVHHLAIGRNIPLPEVVAWLTGLAPRGVIEFVPKSDPMVQGMLALREDIFDDYTLDAFLASLSEHAKITRQTEVSQTGRSLVWYDRCNR